MVMFYKDGKYTVKQVEDIDSLAYYLTQIQCTDYNGFEYKGYLFINCSTNSNKAQKYAIFKKDSTLYLDTIAFGWCTLNQARKYIENVINSEYENKQNIGTRYRRYTIDEGENTKRYLCA